MDRSIQFFLVGLVFLASSPGGALEVGDWARCVVLDQVNSQGKNSVSCIMRPEKKTQPYTVLEFVSTSCETCTKQLSKVSQFVSAFSNRVSWRQVVVNSSILRIRNYLRKQSKWIHFPVAFDLDGDAKLSYSVGKLPTTFLLKKIKTGMHKIIYKHTGALEAEHFEVLERFIEE